jgi:lipocalin
VRAQAGVGDDAAAPAASVRGGRTAADAVNLDPPAAVTKNSAPVAAPAADPAPAPAAAVAAPAAATQAAAVVDVPAPFGGEPAVVTTPAPAATVPTAAQAAPVDAIVVVPHRGGGATVVAAGSAPAPAAAAPVAVAAPAPAAASVVDVLAGLGLLGTGGAVAGTPALTSWTGQLSDPQPAAVVGTSLAAAAPPDPKLPALPTNGVSGVQVGKSQLKMPGSFIGDTVAADWYFPTQVDGTVKAQGVIWLQHGFGATNVFYSALATELATKTNSIVVAPNLSSIPFTFSGSWLNGEGSQEAAAAIMLDPNRTELVKSAQAAGFTGDTSQLKGKFVMSGHSAGGGFASAVGADYVDAGTLEQDANLIGVVMFDGVSNGAFGGGFTDEVKALAGAGKPIYQIAAPSQIWNAFGATTNQLLAANPGKFDGVVLVNGSHVDSMLGVNPLFDGILQLVAGKVPTGNTAATYLLSTGWINDFYAGATPTAPQYGLYAGANQQIIFGPAAGIALPTPTLNQISGLDSIFKSLTDTIFKLFGIPPTPEVNTGSNGVNALVAPPKTNGVTGVKTGSSDLVIPSGNGYNAPADWYFPTQADGAVQANGVIWLQHGFLGFKEWYADMAYALAQETNSIVVVPQINWFDPAFSGQAAAEMFTGTRPALNVSANAAGLQGTLPQKFILTGHSAGGRFATTAGAGTVDNGAATDLLGIVMFDGVDGSDQFAASIAKLQSLGIPDYQIAALAQRWNAWGGTTEQLSQLLPGQFVGTMIDNGSHTDSIGGDSLWGWLGEIGSDIFVKPSPPGAKVAVRTFATGWINDFYAGLTPGDTQPKYGIYGNPNDGTYVPDQPIVMGQAGATTLPAPPPVDAALYGNGQPWYEQASVKLPFAWGLVNTKAVYTFDPVKGIIKVENSGNYFGPNGPQSNITGSAVPVNSYNTRLNVGFFFGTPNDREPGNYTILDWGTLENGKIVGGKGLADVPKRWVIVSDPSGFSGYILTGDQAFSTKYPEAYQQLLTRARQLGVSGPITPTQQFPAGSAAAV